MVRGDRCLMVELKSAGGKASVAQLEWLSALARAGIDARLWRTQDWISGEIEAVLRKETR